MQSISVTVVPFKVADLLQGTEELAGRETSSLSSQCGVCIGHTIKLKQADHPHEEEKGKMVFSCQVWIR